jgi:hypothetical protein
MVVMWKESPARLFFIIAVSHAINYPLTNIWKTALQTQDRKDQIAIIHESFSIYTLPDGSVLSSGRGQSR